MKRWIGAGLVLTVGLGGSASWAQIVERERDVTITGPRGRTIERSIKTERGPGFVDRQVNIQRPGGSFHSNVMAQRLPHGRPAPGFRGGFGPRPYWGWGPRPVVVNEGIGLGPALLGGAGLFGLGMVAGSAVSSQPAYPAPVYVAPAQPPVVVVNQPQPYSPTPPPPATVVVDPVVDAMNRLKSHHNHSRRDGALTLGTLRDSRAVPALLDRLKNDFSPEVRVAAATALGEIGDPRASLGLERASVYDWKQSVRDAAAAAYSRLPREVPANHAVAPPVANVPASGTSVPAAPAIEEVPPPPTPATPSGFPDMP